MGKHWPDVVTMDHREYKQGSKAIPGMQGLRDMGNALEGAYAHALDGHMGSRGHMAI